MEPYSRGYGMKQPCVLFVPLVKDSMVCGVCRFHINQHSRKPIVYPDSNRPIYVSASELPRTAVMSPISKPNQATPDSKASSTNASPGSTHKCQLTPSETSAFEQYAKSPSSEHSSPPSEVSIPSRRSERSAVQEPNNNPYELRKSRTFTDSRVILKPKPQYITPIQIGSEPVYYRPIPTLFIDDPKSNDDRSPSNIYRRIKAKHKERSSSSGRRPEPSPPSEPSVDPRLENSVIVQKESVPRAHNFKQILDRFQNASEQQAMRERKYRSMRGRDANRRFTVDSFVLQHTQTNKSSRYDTIPNAPSLRISIPKSEPLQRRGLPEGWMRVKETDIDDIPPTPAFSESSLSPPPPPVKHIPIFRDTSTSDLARKKAAQEAILRKSATDSLKDSDSGRAHDPRHSKLIINNRSRPLSQSDLMHSESNSAMALLERKVNGSGRSSVTVSIPLSDDAGSESPVPCVPSPSRSSTRLTPSSHPPPTPITNNRAKSIDEAYQQMTLSHRESLAHVSDNLAEYARSRDVSIPSDELNKLKFSEIIFKSFTPTLIKGASMFFDAAIPRSGQTSYDVTLMMAPSSQYYPLSIIRRPAEEMLYSPPVLVEIEDSNGDMRRFLQDSSHLAGRTCKAIVMPRLTLLSFHSLAAHNVERRMDADTYERHVCFIMMQLVSALKSLQSDGVEHLSNNFREFLLAYRQTNFSPPLNISEYPRIMLLRETVSDDLEESNEGSVGVCRYALRALCTLLHHKMDSGVPVIINRSKHSTALLKCAALLEDDKSSSLSAAKNILEYSFWLGTDTVFDSEFHAKIWLDSQRSKDVDRLLRAFVVSAESLKETVERSRVQFLLSITPRSLFNSSLILRKPFC